jgi:hypothetical protein
MNISVHVLAVAALLAGAPVLATGPADVAVKCPVGTSFLFPDAPDFVTVLDGKLSSQEELAKVEPESIASITIVCANELYQRYKVKARLSGTVVFTKEYVARTASSAGGR